jgi:uroporphyrinogen-III synthase
MALKGRTLVITRPAGTAGAMARQIRARGGVPVLLPGLSLRAADDAVAARAALREALDAELVLFTSPAAVRFAAALLPLATPATVLAVGQGTARVLHRHGLAALAPGQRQDSEGLLALPALQSLHGRRVALVGAPGGRGLLRDQLVARGARLHEAHVYRRVPPRLGRQHVEALRHLSADARVLLSSAEALQSLHALLPPSAWRNLCAALAVVSSERLAQAARAAGFGRVRVAASARAADLLAAAE